MSISLPKIKLSIGIGKRYSTQFEDIYVTDKSAQKVGAMVKRQLTATVNKLKAGSPVSTGLLKRSWEQFSEVKMLTTDKRPIKRSSPPSKLAAVAPTAIKALKDEAVVAKGVVSKLAKLSLNFLFGKRFGGKLWLILYLWKLLPGMTKKAVVLNNLANQLIAHRKQQLAEAKRASKLHTLRVFIRISNRAPNSYFRIVGRAPGKMPPAKKLEAWAKRANLPPGSGYVIARKIAVDGTERYRTGQNVVGINPTKQVHRKSSELVRLLERIDDAI